MRPLLALLACCAALVAAAAPASRGAAGQNPCGIPDSQPLWIDFGDGSVPFWNTVFKRPGLVIAASGLTVTPQYRAAGVPLVYFDLYLNNRVGTPSQPADPALIPTRAGSLFDRAVQSTGCETPWIALNELFGSNTPTPWTPTTVQYRANVLAFVQVLAARGARPYLLLSTRPYVGGEAADWWRQIAKVSSVVPEVYFSGPSISKPGPVVGNRRLRTTLRQRVRDFVELGIPVSRLGVMLGFQSTPGAGGREGLKPKEKWFEVVKWQALAARQVSSEVRFGSIWSWGWAAFSAAGQDPDKAAAACVYLWARDPGLCDGPATAGPGFDASRSEGQLSLPAGAICTVGRGTVKAAALAALTRVTGDRESARSALLRRLVLDEHAPAGAGAGDVAGAERFVVAARYAGSRSAYLGALARMGASAATARGVLADELRRIAIEQTLRAAVPSGPAILEFQETYADTRAREVVVDAPAPWLGQRTHGVALDGHAPVSLFRLRPGERSTVQTLGGTWRVRVIGETLPLGAFPLQLARASIVQALVDQARDDAFHDWVVARLQGALGHAVCIRDDLPEPADVDPTDWLPFLRLS